MRRFVTVELRRTAPPTRYDADPARPGYAVSARPATADGPAGGRLLLLGADRRGVRWAPVRDEHLAVDLDRCRERRWLDCADVLQGSRPCPAADAACRLAEITAAHPGCGLAAVPLVGGGWAAVGGADRRVVTLPCRTPPQWSLLPSCLHGWLVAGGSLRELVSARCGCGTRVSWVSPAARPTVR
ncbi:hypothetical protein ACIQGZ_00800 [Streptomyces sp. NPDC092296]|uniref:hypothetical protein n=1 Tax=Streptomyces sp. NPDC092296 TaxID=3366012 RepID=UPI00382D177B